MRTGRWSGYSRLLVNSSESLSRTISAGDSGQHDAATCVLRQKSFGDVAFDEDCDHDAYANRLWIKTRASCYSSAADDRAAAISFVRRSNRGSSEPQ